MITPKNLVSFVIGAVLGSSVPLGVLVDIRFFAVATFAGVAIFAIVLFWAIDNWSD